MIQPRWLQNKSLRKIALASSVLCLSLVFSSVALAGYNPRNPTRPGTTGSGASRYNPPNPTRPSGPTGSGGSRGEGCETVPSSQSDLTLLAPQKHIGLTGSAHPTFVWFVSEQKSYPVELTLFEYSQDKGRGQPIQTFKLESLPGVMHLSLLEKQMELSVGKAYVWQVALICSRNSPAKNPWMQAVVEVVQPPPDLEQALSSTTDPLKRAELYTQAGFWYDALTETLKTPTAKLFRQTLLTDLGKLESPEQRARLEAVKASER